MRAYTMTAAILLMATAGCDLPPTPQSEAPPADIVVDTHYHLTSEGPDGRTILSFDRWGQVGGGGQLLPNGDISGGPLNYPECRDDLVRCTYGGGDFVPVALTTAPDIIARFYEARNFLASATAQGDCLEVEVRSAGLRLKRYRYCRIQGLMEVEAFAATGLPRKIALFDNCGIGSSEACEAQVPPVPLALPER